jgi:hypothetical protein
VKEKIRYTYEITVEVPDDISAGEPSLEMADALDVVEKAHPDWHVGNFDVSAVDGIRLE